MRVAALYDVHGNVPALRAVLEEIEGAEVELVLFGGDLASGPLPRTTLELAQALGERAVFVRGNADREMVAAFDERRWERTGEAAEQSAEEVLPDIDALAARAI